MPHMGILSFFKRTTASGGNDRLIGKWLLVGPASHLDAGDGVEVEFADGRLDYIIRDAGQKQIMKLMYRIDGDEIITNQPSAPREERSKFEFVGDHLVVTFGGKRSQFSRMA